MWMNVHWTVFFFILIFLLQGNLLVTLSFDFSEFSLCKVDIDALNVKYGVLISWRDKNKQNSKSIAIKGKEKFIGEFSRQCRIKPREPNSSTKLPSRQNLRSETRVTEIDNSAGQSFHSANLLFQIGSERWICVPPNAGADAQPFGQSTAAAFDSEFHLTVRGAVAQPCTYAVVQQSSANDAKQFPQQFAVATFEFVAAEQCVADNQRLQQRSQQLQ